MNIEYRRGLHELGDGLYAYLQPDGGWGWSNAGLVTAGGTSLLVDTLFDLRLTREMLDAMRGVTDRHPIDAAVNTHANGDHCFGNALLPASADIYASAAAATEMPEAPPQALQALKQADLGPEFRRYIGDIFGPFAFEDVTLRPPTATFEGRLELRVGDRAVEIVEVGPAHTLGDAFVHVPDAGTSRTRGFALVLGVLSLPFSGLLLLRRGRLMTISLALVHGAVRLVASGGIDSGVLARLGGAFSGYRRALFGCCCPLLGEPGVLLVAVHRAIFSIVAFRSPQHSV